ncbi:MAG TPA: hypothetical protein V6C97_19485 [Oculatellaceae cyanobacterium]
MEVTYPGARGIRQWLTQWPKESVERLRVINNSHGSSTHILLALAFGAYDRHIRKLNGLITGLLLARMRSERAGRSESVARLNALMEELHIAIDAVTGTQSNRSKTPCNRPSGIART